MRHPGGDGEGAEGAAEEEGAAGGRAGGLQESGEEAESIKLYGHIFCFQNLLKDSQIACLEKENNLLRQQKESLMTALR